MKLPTRRDINPTGTRTRMGGFRNPDGFVGLIYSTFRISRYGDEREMRWTYDWEMADWLQTKPGKAFSFVTPTH